MLSMRTVDDEEGAEAIAEEDDLAKGGNLFPLQDFANAAENIPKSDPVECISFLKSALLDDPADMNTNRVGKLLDKLEKATKPKLGRKGKGKGKGGKRASTEGVEKKPSKESATARAAKRIRENLDDVEEDDAGLESEAKKQKK